MVIWWLSGGYQCLLVVFGGNWRLLVVIWCISVYIRVYWWLLVAIGGYLVVIGGNLVGIGAQTHNTLPATWNTCLSVPSLSRKKKKKKKKNLYVRFNSSMNE